VLAAFELLGFIAYYQGDYKTAVSYSEISLELATELDAPQAIGYAKLLLALDQYGEGSLQEARDAFQEALVIFQDINDCRNVAGTYVNLARTAYYQRDYNTAYQYLEDSLVISLALKISWVKGFVYETKGMLQCSEGNIEGALASFQESLRISDDQENLQRISDCFMALAGLALAQNEARRAVRLFAAAARLRHDMGVKISSNDRVEYEQHLALVHEHLDHATFEAEWSEGFSLTTQKIMEDLNEWLDEIAGMQLADSPVGQCETHRLHHALPESPKLTANSIVCSKGRA
jgi:tetratricopeptide (TPR) repeat protein